MVKYILIDRKHIQGSGKKGNSFGALGKYLNKKTIELEPTKGFIKINEQVKVSSIRKKVKLYNKKFDTDFNL